jgi:hypothetical protein
VTLFIFSSYLYTCFVRCIYSTTKMFTTSLCLGIWPTLLKSRSATVYFWNYADRFPVISLSDLVYLEAESCYNTHLRNKELFVLRLWKQSDPIKLATQPFKIKVIWKPASVPVLNKFCIISEKISWVRWTLKCYLNTCKTTISVPINWVYETV